MICLFPPRRFLFCALSTAAAFFVAHALQAEPAPGEAQTIKGSIFAPIVEKPSPGLVSTLKLPAGFKIAPFAEGLIAPRMMAVAENGDVYVTRRGPFGDVHLLRDADGDGRAEIVQKVLALDNVHGIAIHQGKVYLAAIRELHVADILPDGTFSEPQVICVDLPDAGQHPNRTLAFSPNGELFLSVGSTANSTEEPNKEAATMLVVSTDGTSRRVFARGLRNTIGFDWHPRTGELWGMDHGIDWLGDDAQKEELNHLVEGKDYGWPYVYENRIVNPNTSPKKKTGLSGADYAKQTEPSVLTYTAHAAPMSLVFYRGAQFPVNYRNGAFVAFHGSWNRSKASGYSVAWVEFNEAGRPVKFSDFITGFLLKGGKKQFGRPCDLVVTKDGALLLSDDGGGVIYRITYEQK